MNSTIENFVQKDSIVRKIWSKSDTILFIFAGSAAEFALNKAVDWLYFTGKLPADPLGRLFSTVTYAREIVFSEKDKAHAAIDKISAIHGSVEKGRGAKIPDWAYRDVLFMLIHYSITSFELLERKLSDEEKDEVYDVFFRLGTRMKLNDLPANYTNWLISRDEHLASDLVRSEYTSDLYKQYKKHLGAFRFKLLVESQKLVVPAKAKLLLGFNNIYWLKMVFPFYKLSRKIKLEGLIKSLILPPEYKQQINALDNTQ